MTIPTTLTAQQVMIPGVDSTKTVLWLFQRRGQYISEFFLDFRSPFHIFAKCKSKIINSHYKAVIMLFTSVDHVTELSFKKDVEHSLLGLSERKLLNEDAVPT